MSKNDPTVAQALEVRSMAIAKGVTREQFQQGGLSGGAFATALNAIKHGKRICFVIEPPPGGRIYTVRVRVDLDRDWQESINAAGPDTPDNYNVRKVGNLYLPTGTGVIEEDVVLTSFGQNGGSWDLAIAWAEDYALKRTDPRRVFAIGEQKPQLHRELGMDPMYVMATQDYSFEGYRQACRVGWRGTERGADLYWVSRYGGADDWFAFSRECPSA